MKLYHETVETQINAEKPRAYYIPFTDRNFSLDLRDSKEVVLLDKWKFAFFKKFEESLFDFSPTDEYDVPFMWQLKGFDYNQYTNFFYPFPFNPPYIDKDIPCGVYERSVTIDDLDHSEYIVFDGVDSCLYLFVNDKFVGYSTVSHSQAEFDITKYLVQGENRIKVVVLKWCFGSYFEDQDKLRMSGIFREAYLLRRPKDHLEDYKITTDIIDDDGYIIIDLDKDASVELYDGEKLLEIKKGSSLSFSIKNAKLWNAETPNLYRLIIEYNGEFIEERVGIRKIEIKDSIFYINGRNVKIRGVNRHSMTTEGYVESYDLLVKDIKMFKENNINAVRTSHYPPHPLFTILCDIYGIYVLEEADLESHGLETIHYYGDPHNMDRFANTKEYKDVYVHRSHRMYERDKNRQSIIMWSMGNEAGWGENFIETSKYLHQVDSRPVHYEGNTTRTDPIVSFRNPEALDVYSMMYTNPDGCMERIRAGLDKPFMLCEYSHAMGNSCGDMKAYSDAFYSDDRFMGGFIWEWTNHSVRNGDGNFIFGGDFNEAEPPSRYDGNFCVDGLVDTSRRPHPSLGEVKQCYAPVDVRYEDGKYSIINRYDFLTLDELECIISVERNGKKVESRTINIKGIGPHAAKSFDIDVEPLDYTTVNFDFIREGSHIAYRQIILSDDLDMISHSTDEATVEESGKKTRVSADTYSLYIGEDGMIESMRNGAEILLRPMKFSFDREPIDNDLPLKDEWQRLRIPYIRSRIREKTVDGNTVLIKGQITPDIVEPLYDYTLKYTFTKDSINVDLKAKKHEYVTSVARFGFAFILPDEYTDVTYFGRGCDECYIDRKQNTPVSLYKGTREDMCFMYQKTQHSGSHVDSRMVSIRNDFLCFTVDSRKDFSFQVTPYEVCDVKRHDFEMNPDTKKTVLHIDYKNTGVGSAACGAPLKEEYMVNDDEIDFSFTIKISDQSGKGGIK